MGKLAKGATTPQSFSELSAKVGQTVVNDAEASAQRRQYPKSKLGVQEELSEFFRVMKIVQSEKNPDYIILTVAEADRLKYDKLGVNTPVKTDRLRNHWFGTTYLGDGMTVKDVDPSTMVSLYDLVHGKYDKDGNEIIPSYLSKDHDNVVDIPQDYYLYKAQVKRSTTTEQPTEKHKLVDIVDDNGKVVEANVYRVTELVGLDGTPIKSVE